MRNNTILVIDDDHDILDAMRFLLEDVGYTVETSERGETAEELVHDGKMLPKLIILDVLLSGKDGRKIAAALKSHPKTKSLPIIMMSAHPSAKESAQKLGADAFIAKPFEVTELLSTLGRFAN